MKRYNQETGKVELTEIDQLEHIMEEMANAPKEEMGKRSPGERQASEPKI